jgi:hypothetical protein
MDKLDYIKIETSGLQLKNQEMAKKTHRRKYFQIMYVLNLEYIKNLYTYLNNKK